LDLPWRSKSVAPDAAGARVNWPSTTDTITYDWQEAQVQNTSGTMLAQIFKVCSNAMAWTPVTYDLTSYKGQTIRVYFNDHGDGFGEVHLHVSG
jgi:hypothetical protein